MGVEVYVVEWAWNMVVEMMLIYNIRIQQLLVIIICL